MQFVSRVLVCNVCRCVAPSREDILTRHSRLLLRLAEQEDIDKILAVGDAIGSVCKIITESVCEFDSCTEALQPAAAANVTLSPTFTLLNILKQVEHYCGLERFEEVIGLLGSSSPEIKAFRDGVSGL